MITNPTLVLDVASVVSGVIPLAVYFFFEVFNQNLKTKRNRILLAIIIALIIIIALMFILFL